MGTLKDVIDDIITEKDDHNSIFRHARRTHIKNLAIRGLKKMMYKLKGNVRAIRLNVPMSQSIETPVDFQDYIRISVMDGCKLKPISYNREIPAYAKQYIQDCGNEILYDCCNEVMSIETLTSCRHSDVAKDCNKCMRLDVCEPCGSDMWFSVSDDKFVFSPSMEGKEIFIEYLSTGWYEDMDECEIKVKSIYHEALIAWIKWQYLRGINEHMGRIDEHRRYYRIESKELKSNIIDFEHNEIIQILDFKLNYR